MKKGNKKIFNEKPLLYRLINMRLNGFAYTSLATYFKCDRDSVEKQCRKYDIDKGLEEVFNIERMVSNILPEIPEERFMVIDGFKICKGKSYKDYVNNYPHSKTNKYELS